MTDDNARLRNQPLQQVAIQKIDSTRLWTN